MISRIRISKRVRVQIKEDLPPGSFDEHGYTIDDLPIIVPAGTDKSWRGWVYGGKKRLVKV